MNIDTLERRWTRLHKRSLALAQTADALESWGIPVSNLDRELERIHALVARLNNRRLDLGH